MYKRLYSYINEKQILYPKQFGFRGWYSTSHALFSINDKIQVAIENRNFAFEFYGIRGLPNYSGFFPIYQTGNNLFALIIYHLKNFYFMWCPSGFSSWSIVIP